MIINALQERMERNVLFLKYTYYIIIKTRIDSFNFSIGIDHVTNGGPGIGEGSLRPFLSLMRNPDLWVA